MLSYYEIIKKSVYDDLLNKAIEQTFDFFEHLVVDLVVAMGYGGSFEDAGRATKKQTTRGLTDL